MPLCWYAIHSQPRMETKAEAHLARQGFEVWLPRIGRRVRKGGVWSHKVEPLFSRLFFFMPIRNSKTLALYGRRGALAISCAWPVVPSRSQGR